MTSRVETGGWRPHPFAVIVTVVALAVTAGLSWAAYTINDHSENRLLQLKVQETGAVFQAAVPQVQTALSSAAEFAASSTDRESAFRMYMTKYVGDHRTFGSASLWQLTPSGPRLVTTLGARPKLANHPAKARATLERTTHRNGLVVVGLLSGSERRLGYAYAVTAPTPDYVVYAESLLPASREVPVTSDSGSPFSDLRFSLYLGKRATPSRLLESNMPESPGRTASAVVPFGDTSLTLVASATDPLGGTLSHELWWIVALAGGLLALGAGAVGERLVRRRLAAEGLAGSVQRLLDEQRGVSETLQRAIVPPEPPPVPGLEIAVRYLPGSVGLEIGGDWYDVVGLGDGRVFLSIGDVSGRGVQAGAVMASLRSAARAFASEGHGPASLLGKLSRLLTATAVPGFATMLCAVIDQRRQTLTLASAGHLPPLLICGGRACYLDAPVGPPVGAVPDPPRYAERTVELPVPGSLLLYTDGLVERRGETIDEGMERLRVSAGHAPRDVGDLLRVMTAELQQSGTQEDDTAMLGVQWT